MCIRDSYVTVQDVFTDQTLLVKEKSFVELGLSPGYLICSRVLSMNDLNIFVGTHVNPLPPRFLSTVIQYKNKLIETGFKFTTSELLSIEVELLDLFHGSVTKLSKMPEIRNMDDELIEFQKIFFKMVCSIDEAFDKLVSLNTSESREEVLNSAVYKNCLLYTSDAADD